MDKYYVIVAGSGETSRANVEALIEDYVYGNGSEVIFVLAYEKNPSTAMTFISQWAKDKSKDLVIFANSDAKYDGLTSATVNETTDPYVDAVSFLSKKDKAVGFILWNDDDPASNSIVDKFNQRSIECFDLTDGLNRLDVTPQVEVEPTIPEAEQVRPEIEQEFEEDDDDEEFEDEESEEEIEDEVLAIAVSLVEALTAVVTDRVLKALEGRQE